MWMMALSVAHMFWSCVTLGFSNSNIKVTLTGKSSIFKRQRDDYELIRKQKWLLFQSFPYREGGKKGKTEQALSQEQSRLMPLI
jgi:hypothetical protein